MSDREQALVLELLLLRNRYSSAEWHRAVQLIREFNDAVAVRDASSELSRISKVQRTSLRSGDETPLSEMKKNFVKLITTNREYSRPTRLQSIAKRFGVTDLSLTRSEIISKIEARLDEIDEGSLREMLGRYKSEVKADIDYLGLANYILRK